MREANSGGRRRLGRSIGVLGLLASLALLGSSFASKSDEHAPYVYGPDIKPGELEDNDAVVRPYANGSGPTAIFRLGHDAASDLDVFGIVDPVGWRIQYFTLESWTEKKPKPLQARLHWHGACRLDPTERVWRVHSWPDKVILQLQPKLTVDDIVGGKWTFPKLVIRADAAALAAIAAGAESRDMEYAPNDACGAQPPAKADAGPFSAGDTAVRIAGGEIVGKHQSVFTATRKPGALPPQASPFLRSEVKLGTNFSEGFSDSGGVLLSAQELELSTDPATHKDLRHFLVAMRSTGVPGFAHSLVGIVRRGDGQPERSLLLDIGLSRVKTGQRIVAVSSVGEVLVIGSSDKKYFYIHACHFLTGSPLQGDACSVSPHATPAGATGAKINVPAPHKPKPPTLTAPDDGDAMKIDMITRTRWYLDQRFQFVPTHEDRPGCKHISPCNIGGYSNDWVVISPLRLATGPVDWRGVPYAQHHFKPEIPSPTNETLNFPGNSLIPDPDKKGAHIIVMPDYARGSDTRKNDTKEYIVSDINNEGLADSEQLDNLTLYGIDCSTFLAQIWGDIGFDTTAGLIADANAGLIERIPTVDQMHFGDVFVINLSYYDPDENKQDYGLLINHVAIYRDPVKAGPDDSSSAFLVLEASSGCGGVCATLYDESFFDGWALIGRHVTPEGGRPANAAAIRQPVPTYYCDWLTLFHPEGGQPEWCPTPLKGAPGP